VSRSLMLRLLESFFRRWYLYLVPVVVLGLVGFLSVSSTKSKFQSTGTFNVESSTVLSNLNGASNQTFGETPATTTTKQINATLQTDQFIKDIATRAGIDGALTSGKITPKWIRSSLTSVPNGANLVSVVATNEDPQVAQRLAQATIDAFVQSVVDAAASQSNAAVTFFGDLVTTYSANVDAAQKAINNYVAAHPAPALGQRPEDEQAELTRLNSALTQAQTTYNTAVSKRQDAELTVQQTKADVGQRLRVIDTPKVPPAPQPKLKSMVFSFATFLVLGILLTVGAVVIATVLNHTLLSGDDVKERLGVRLLAVVPEGSGKPVRPPKTVKVKAPKPAKAPKTPKEPKEPRKVIEKPTARPAAVKPIAGTRRTGAASAPAPGASRVRAGQPRHVGRASGTGGWPG
jgi:uncharacterized protein involved in exopolysaccharide biosynthesis